MFGSELEVLEDEIVLKNIIMKSAAGFYLGGTYLDSDFGIWVPYSRESGYFKSEKEVIEAFPFAKRLEDAIVEHSL